MTENVTHVDFGKEQRESARRLARLLSIVEERDEDLLKDPKKYFDRAVDEIIRLREVVRTAQEELRPQLSWRENDSIRSPAHLKTWTVDKDEWERWRRAVEIIRSADV